MRELRHGVMFTLTGMLLFGGAYPVVVWTVGQAAFRDRASGTLIMRADGAVIGSRLIAQRFEGAKYFHPRPSAVGYNAASSGGSNKAPSIAARSEMVTASGSGLDPHISPESAESQLTRVAHARGVDIAAIRDIVRAHVEGPTFGLLGRPRINVLELNLALDAEFKEER